MVESRQNFEQRDIQDRISSEQPYSGNNANIGNRPDTKYNQPYQQYGGSANISSGYARNDSNPAIGSGQNNQQNRQSDKDDTLSRVLLGGLIGGTLGSLAAAFAGKRIAQGFSHAARGIGEAAKTVGSGLMQTGQGLGEAVKSVAEGTSYAVVGGALDTASGVADGVTQVAAGTMDAVQNTAEGVSQVVKSGADVVQNTAEGLSQAVKSGADALQNTVKSGADAVQNTAENANQSVQYATDTFKYQAQQTQSSTPSSNQYSGSASYIGSQPMNSGQNNPISDATSTTIVTPSDIGVQSSTASLDIDSLEDEINRADSTFQ